MTDTTTIGPLELVELLEWEGQHRLVEPSALALIRAMGETILMLNQVLQAEGYCCAQADQVLERAKPFLEVEL